MKVFVIFLLVIGISLLHSGIFEVEARTVYPLHIVLEDTTINQHSFITADEGIPVVTMPKEQTVSIPFKVNPLVSEPLSVTFSHSIETAMPDSRKATIPNMKIEFEPFNMVLKPHEPQILNVTITTLSYTQLGEHRITVTAQYPQGEPLLNTGFDVLVINTDTNPCWDTTENHARPCTTFESEEFFDFMGSAWMESKHQEMLGALQSDTLHDWIEQTPNHYHWNVYQYYSNTDDYMEYLSHQSPLKQVQSGIQFNEIQCKDGLVLIQKYDGMPACVTESTKQKLIKRGWTHTIPANLTLHDGQSWGYIKDVAILGDGYIGITMSYPTNEAYHELYPYEYNSIIGNCNVQDDSANLSVLYLNDVDSDANTITFTKEDKIFDGMSCDDAFWDEMTQNGYCGPTPHLMSQRGTLVSSVTDAQNMVDFELDVPKYLPEGYGVQKIRVDDDRKRAMLFISPFSVTSETDMCAFTWSDGGIYLSYASLPEGAPRFSNDPDRERITINENRGYEKHREIGDRAGTPIPQRSEVTWHIPKGNLVLNMYSSLPSEELIKIAESIR